MTFNPGTARMLGILDGQNVPTLQGDSFFSGPPFKQNGEYVNEVRFFQKPAMNNQYGGVSLGDFYAWTGSDWKLVDPATALQLWKDKDIHKGNTENPNEYKSIKVVPMYKGDKRIMYPRNLAQGSMAEYVMFDFYEYVPPFKGQKPLNILDLPDDLKQLKQKSGNRQLIINESLAGYNSSAASADYYNQDTMAYPQIILYTPDNISTTFGAEWEGKSFGTAATGILAAAAAEGNLETIKRIGGVGVNALQKLPAEAGAALITNLAKGITGDQINASDVFGGIAGVIRNPNTELLFQKMKLRTFDLTFKLIPYNRDEANDIRRILNIFQKAMLPTFSIGDLEVLGQNKEESQTQNRSIEASFVKVPKVCRVAFMRGDKIHPILPKYKMCAITDVQINYTPDGNYAVYSDGNPVAVELKVNFLETKLVFAEDIRMDEDDDLIYRVAKETNEGPAEG